MTPKGHPWSEICVRKGVRKTRADLPVGRIRGELDPRFSP